MSKTQYYPLRHRDFPTSIEPLSVFPAPRDLGPPRPRTPRPFAGTVLGPKFIEDWRYGPMPSWWSKRAFAAPKVTEALTIPDELKPEVPLD